MKSPILFFVCLFFALNAYSQDFVAKTDSLLSYLHAQHRFTGNIQVSKGNKILYSKQFIANEDNKNWASTIGSVSKMFTAVMIFQLAEEGKIDLNSTINTYFPQIPNSEIITIKQLLRHESGIADVTQFSDFMQRRTYAFTKEEMLNYISSEKPAFKPGKSVDYSNSNYILLSYIIENATGMDYATAVKLRITEKLVLKNTWMPTTLLDTARRNLSFTFDGIKWQPMLDETHFKVASGAGSMVSSPADLTKFIQGLFNGKLVSKSSLDTMLTLAGGNTGHGIFLAPYKDHKGYGHTGSIDGFRSAITYFPDDSVTIAMCLNGVNYSMNNIAMGILAYYYNEPFEIPNIELLSIDTEQLKKYEGIYRLKLFHLIPITKIKIEAANGALFVASEENFESDKLIAEAVRVDVFKNYMYKTELNFLYKNNGKLKGFKMLQGNTSLYCKKLN
jgi:D-alanyl-D-alanine carboxypeptidase